jgi:hypothetical protein
MDDQDVQRIAVIGTRGRDETPIVRIRQTCQQWLRQREGTEAGIEFQFGVAPSGISTTA